MPFEHHSLSIAAIFNMCVIALMKSLKFRFDHFGHRIHISCICISIWPSTKVDTFDQQEIGISKSQIVEVTSSNWYQIDVVLSNCG